MRIRLLSAAALLAFAAAPAFAAPVVEPAWSRENTLKSPPVP